MAEIKFRCLGAMAEKTVNGDYFVSQPPSTVLVYENQWGMGPKLVAVLKDVIFIAYVNSLTEPEPAPKAIEVEWPKEVAEEPAGESQGDPVPEPEIEAIAPTESSMFITDDEIPF